jgi:superfamily II DNA or RNA helicase
MSLVERTRRAFEYRTQGRGYGYANGGRVRNLRVRDRGVLVEVAGSEPFPYEVEIECPAERPSMLIVGCTCPIGGDGVPCKHVFATLVVLDGKGIDLGAQGKSLRVAVRDHDDHDEIDDESREIVLERAVAPRQVVAPSWRERLAWLAPPFPKPAGASPEIYYRLATLSVAQLASGHDTAMRVTLGRVVRKKDGTITQHQGLALELATAPLDTAERARIDLLLGCTPSLQWSYSYGSTPGQSLTGAAIHPTAVERVVPALCASGRFGVIAPDAAAPGGKRFDALSWDGDTPFRARLRGEPHGHGARFALELVRGDEVLDLARVSFVSTQHLIVGTRLVRVDGVEELGRWVLSSPMTVAAREVPALIDVLANARAAPPLELIALGWTSEARALTPRLYLEPSDYPGRMAGRLAFAYGTLEVGGQGTIAVDAAAVRLVARDRGAEARAREHLWRLCGRSEAGFDASLEIARIGEIAALLVAAGWELFVRGGRVRTTARTRTRVTTGIDWFDVAFGIEDDGVEADQPEILRAIREGNPFVRLSDGSMALLGAELVASQRRVATLGRANAGTLRVPRAAAALLDALLGDADVDASFRELRKRLAKAADVKAVGAPRGFRGELRPYQREGLGWFRFLGEVGLGGCLADDMGLGKTVQTLAQVLAARGRGRPSLVVAPKSVVFNWIDEARRFAPGLEVIDYTGAERHARRDAIAGADLVVTSYALVRSDIDELSARDFEYVILDEAQAIKNPKAKITEAARRLRARHRLALSGTPVENHLGDLASILEFLNPGLVDASKALRALVEAPDGGTDLSPLARALRPFLLRRTKDQVLTELPPRTEQVLRCELGAEQRRLYDQLAAHYRASLLPQVARGGVARNAINVLAALLRLRQAACHPGLVDPTRETAASAKLDALLEHVAEATESGHKALVFSQFTHLLALVRDRLDAAGIAYEYLDGQTRDRKARVERFSADPDCRVFLVSLKAGGTGLNLVAADYVYLLDPWWNPAVEAQAIDRTHRIGQARPVFAYRLIAEDTVEDKILMLQEKKRELAAGIFAEDAGALAKLTAADLEILFS